MLIQSCDSASVSLRRAGFGRQSGAPERRAVDGGRLRLVHSSPEEVKIVRHGFCGHAVIGSESDPLGLRNMGRQRGLAHTRVPN